MHRYLAVALTVVLLLAGGLSPIAAPTARAETTVKVSINDPQDGETISEPRDVVFVGGHAYARGEEAPAFDIAILIDTSGSILTERLQMLDHQITGLDVEKEKLKNKIRIKPLRG